MFKVAHHPPETMTIRQTVTKMATTDKETVTSRFKKAVIGLLLRMLLESTFEGLVNGLTKGLMTFFAAQSSSTWPHQLYLTCVVHGLL